MPIRTGAFWGLFDRLGGGDVTARHEQLIRASVLRTRRLHLACGIAGLGHGAKLLSGWTNIDIEGDGKNTFAWNLTEPLPLSEGSVDGVYFEHFIEHLSLEEGRRLLAECRRLLAPGGVVRISTPDLVTLVRKYLEGDVREWADMGWEPKTPCDLLNEGMRNWFHLYVYDEVKLSAELVTAGFRGIVRCRWGESTHKPLCGLETRPDHGDLILEAQA
ncbi:methyltransferase domain-containing protein [bacterium]|jgi:predicted SAM-dependent methyltransferase|nr:methyltransferase domain-containing protein [bacterium]